jgi:hypothetical protein
VQASNAAYYAKIGEHRDVKVDDYVMVANEAETEKTAIANKQRQAGPYKVVSINGKEKRVVLRRLAGDQSELDRPVSMNRLQVVSKEMVEQGVEPGEEPGATTFMGPSDAKLLLSGERGKVEKEVENAEKARVVQQKKQEERARKAEQVEAASKAREEVSRQLRRQRQRRCN